jgi:tRNA pseudouridine38-40 synthase
MQAYFAEELSDDDMPFTLPHIKPAAIEKKVQNSNPTPPTEAVNHPPPLPPAATVTNVVAVEEVEEEEQQQLTETDEAPKANVLPSTKEEADITIKTKDNQANTNSVKYKKKKMALYIAYIGHGYQGMQRNPGAKTIEEDLFQAISAAGGISDANSDDSGFSKISWMRAARTDKGVSAVGQVVSLKMQIDPPENMLEKINQQLPHQISLLGIHRVTGGFDARKHCDKRRYEYCLPAWIFDPAITPQNAMQTVHYKGGAGFDDGVDFHTTAAAAAADPPFTSSFIFDKVAQDKMTQILSSYNGTHNFHNYAARVHVTSSNAKRYIMSFTCHGTFQINGEPWVRMVVIGQSFMLHQIRKLIGMALSVFRGDIPEHFLKIALKSKASLNVPMAPDLGLFLDECYFDSYNNKWGHLHGPINLTTHQAAVDVFKQERLYPHLARRDEAEGINGFWLSTVTEENFGFSKWEEMHAEADRHGPQQPTKRQQKAMPQKGSTYKYKGNNKRSMEWNGDDNGDGSGGGDE